MDNTETQYTSSSAAEQHIASLTQAVKQGYSGLPGVTEALRKSLYSREKTLPGLENDYESKIKELYDADKRYADVYANPESQMYIEDPMARQSLVSGQKADTRGQLGNVLNLIQQRNQTLGSALDKGLDMYKYGLQAQEFELKQAESAYDRLYRKEQDSKKGSGKDYSGQAAFAQWLLGQQGMGKQPTEPKPSNKVLPTNEEGRDNTKINWRSPAGQWNWDFQSNDWTPIGGTGGGEIDISSLQELINANPEIASTVISNYTKIFPKGNELNMTEEYRQDLQEARSRVSSGSL